MMNEVGTYFPKELFNEILKYSKSSFVALSCTKKQFNRLTKDYVKNHRPIASFDKIKWEKYNVNSVGKVSLPLKMYQDFDSTTEILTLIPRKLNNKQLTLKLFDEFVKKTKNSDKSNYSFSLNEYGIPNSSVKKSHWVRLSQNIVPESITKTSKDKKGLLKSQGFEIPSLIDVVVSVFMHHLETGVFIYPTKPLPILTQVREKNSQGLRIYLGGFSAERGLEINVTTIKRTIGVAYSKSSP